jgi:hypothetical protein
MKKLPSKRKTVSQEGLEIIKLRANLKDTVENFLKYPHMKRLNRNLRKILMLYLTYDNETLPLDFDDFMIDLYFLHNFLDMVEDGGKT